MAAKRPSLAESMRTVATGAEPQIVTLRPDAPKPEPAQIAPERVSGPKPFYAATRAGKKKVTAALAPADHKHLKSLAVERETTTEALLNEAIADLFAKYGRASVA